MKDITKTVLILAAILFISCGQMGSTEMQVDANSRQLTEMKADTGVKNALLFINGYVKNANRMKKSAGMIEWVNSNNLSNKSFKQELKRLMDEAYKNEPELGPEADPILNAQDYPHSGFELESFDEKTGYIKVRGIDRPGFRLVMRIKPEDGNWLVDGCGVINIPENKRAGR